MKPGDLIVVAHSTAEVKIDDDIIGLTGMIVRPVTFEDGHPINSWCDWWVLLDDQMQPWAAGNLRVIDESR